MLTAMLIKIRMFLEVMPHHRVFHKSLRALHPFKLRFLFTLLKCHVSEKFKLLQQYFDYIHLYTYIRIFTFGGKQWQTTPKNLPKIQRIGAMPAA